MSELLRFRERLKRVISENDQYFEATGLRSVEKYNNKLKKDLEEIENIIVKEAK